MAPRIDHERLAALQQAAEEAAAAPRDEAIATTTRPFGLRPLGERIEMFRERLERERADRDALQAAERARLGVACLDCHDTGRVGWGERTICRCAAGEPLRRAAEVAYRDQWQAGAAEQIGVPRRFRACSLESFPNRHSTTVAAIADWLASLGDGTAPRPGLLLAGPFGRGKTGLVAAALTELVLMAGESDAYDRRPTAFGQFTTATGLLESLRPRGGASRWEPDDERGELLRRYQRVPYLVLDDLGAERLTEWGADRLFEVVNERHNALRTLIVTSNLTPERLAERINGQVELAGDRIVERLIESCVLVQFSDRDPNWRLS